MREAASPQRDGKHDMSFCLFREKWKNEMKKRVSISCKNTKICKNKTLKSTKFCGALYAGFNSLTHSLSEFFKNKHMRNIVIKKGNLKELSSSLTIYRSEKPRQVEMKRNKKERYKGKYKKAFLNDAAWSTFLFCSHWHVQVVSVINYKCETKMCYTFYYSSHIINIDVDEWDWKNVRK